MEEQHCYYQYTNSRLQGFLLQVQSYLLNGIIQLLHFRFHAWDTSVLVDLYLAALQSFLKVLKCISPEPLLPSAKILERMSDKYV